jgi:hypothetical protein
MIAGLKILLLILIMADPLPKDEAKLKKEKGAEWVRPKQVLMVKSVQEAALQAMTYESIPGIKWDKKLLILDLEANKISEIEIPVVQFVSPQAPSQPLQVEPAPKKK